MSQPITLIVGGTKVLERELQNAQPQSRQVSVATIEEAARVLGQPGVALIVLGPTLRRALAMVSTLRREGQTDPKLMVVYRDDLREEVRRHQKGKAVADSYIAQSRIQHEVAAAITAMQSGQGGVDDLSEDTLEEIDDVTQMLDVVAPGDVLGAFDATALPAEDLESLDEELVEEVQDEELELDELDIEAVEEDADDATELEAVELVEEIEALDEGEAQVTEMIDDLEVEELEEEAVEAEAAAVPAAPAAATASAVPATQSPPTQAAATPATPPARTAEATAQAATTRPPSGAHTMLGELTSFVEKLQEAAQTIARLEAENEELRGRLATAQESAARADAHQAEAAKLQTQVEEQRAQVEELRVRLHGAEEARSAAVDARMRAEQQAAARDDELSALRGTTSGLQAQVESAKKAAAVASEALQAVARSLSGS